MRDSCLAWLMAVIGLYFQQCSCSPLTCYSLVHSGTRSNVHVYIGMALTAIGLDARKLQAQFSLVGDGSAS